MEEQNHPADQQPPAPQSSSKLTIILALILTAIVAAFLAYYFTQQYYASAPVQDQNDQTQKTQEPAKVETQDASEKPDEESGISQEPSSNLLLANLERTVGMNANPNSLQLHIVSHESPDGTEKELANITANRESYKAVYFYDSKVYYITLEAQLGSYDLTTGKTEIINIPGVDNSNEGYMRSYSISDFAFDKGKIVYMKGECAEAAKCTVGVYDLVSKENKIILENFMDVIKPIIMDVTRIENYNADTGIAVLTDNGGDAGWGMTIYYELNVNTGKITKVDTIESLACGNEPDSMIGPCDPQQVANNKHYDEVAAKQFTMCGDVKVKTNEYWRITIEAGNKTESLEDTSFVACQ